jgi:uncharacterized protein YqhQ
MQLNHQTEERLPNYGGQALIEGVLMRGKYNVVGAFRSPQGEIILESEELEGIYKSKIAKLPFFRGLVILWDSLSLGMKFLTISANVQAENEEEKIEGGALFLTVLLSIALSISVFFVLPTLLASAINKVFGLSNFSVNVIEGLVRLFLLIGYLFVIGFSKEIARVFQYHGAEHKTINAYESGIQLSVENIRNYPLAHARCGTSFLLTLVLLSIIFFSIMGPMPVTTRIITRVLFVPLLAMLSYEVIRWMGNHSNNLIVHTITTPNLLLQRLTTREPDQEQIEVALASFNKLLTLENQK